MLKILTICMTIPLMTGCAVLSKSRPVSKSVAEVDVNVQVAHSPSVVPPGLKKPQMGFIAGRTDFRGLLKAPYVRLLIVRRDDPDWQYTFYVGSKENVSLLPWEKEKFIEPGYFTLMLPPGAYKMTQIAIPVGATVAEEAMELDFDVDPGKINYVGTLDIEGTKEKVKFGGVPFIRPGFSYNLKVIDDFQTARDEIRRLIVDKKFGLEKKLFNIISATGGEIPPSDLLHLK